MPKDPRCDYPWHPIREENRVAAVNHNDGVLRKYRCPHCGAESLTHFPDEVEQYGKA